MSDPPPTRPEASLRPAQYRLLDAWRGVACLMIVVHHAGFAVLAGGANASSSLVRRAIAQGLWRMNLGVPLFFVISGYCIAASASGSARRGGTAGAFLRRRIRRIYPPYWAALALFVGAIAALDAVGLAGLHLGTGTLELTSPGRLSWPQWLGNLTLTETWRPRFGGPPESVFTRVAWSLCSEEQFYALCTLALWAAPRRLWAALGWGSAAILGLTLAARDVGLGRYLEGTFFARWHEFAIGLAVFWRLNVAESRAGRRAADLGLIALLALAGPLRGRINDLTIPPRDADLDATVAACGFGLALIALRRLDDRASRWPPLRPLFACGRRSYSLYLVHLLPCTIACRVLFEQGLRGFWAQALITVPIASAVGVGAGWAFFAAVEGPLLKANPPREPVGFEPMGVPAPTHGPERPTADGSRA